MQFLTIRHLKKDRKRIFLRADLNISFKKNLITDDFRLRALLETLQLLKNSQHVIIASHRGNPDPGTPDPSLSTQLLVPWFHDHGYPVYFAPTIQAATEHMAKTTQSFILLENLRFFHGEKGLDISFAQQLAELADIYVNDAFGALHRADTSLTLLPQQFSAANRGIGLLVEREMATLDALAQSPEQPFMLVLGGSKLDDKIPLIEHMLTKQPKNRPHSIIIGGALSFPFLAAQGAPVDTLALNSETIATAGRILKLAMDCGITIQLPTDFVGDSKDIGPATIAQFASLIAQARTIFTNGTMGLYEQEAYQAGTHAILNAIAQTPGTKVAGGGDCVAAVHQFALQGSFSFLSTGGGATLAYLASKDPAHELPGLQALTTPL